MQEHESNKCIKILVGKLLGKKPVGSLSHKWEDSIKPDL
jgi:hypothetical protein